ncbi:MAG: 4Fe-4S dicluster domain-containing protein [Elusimicrobia bacterium]|nr:4Fe-4S dicluster domain-containing protein [Elusimicrobiota bacterium]
MEKKDIIERVRRAGVVGAGGGGFPAHVKIAASVDTVIANGAECEPLLSTDRYLMENRAAEIMQGLGHVKKTTGAKNVFIALKKKYPEAAESVRKAAARDKSVRVALLDNYYPAGDEFELVYNITGRIIPEGGIPLSVGAVVINVNTLVNINAAVESDTPVVTRWVTVAGEVEEPYIAEVPVGISAGELIDRAVPLLKDYAVIAGGPMMGKVVERSFSITKLCGGLIVLKPDHPLVAKHSAGFEAMARRAKSTCDQCFDCTIVCPRNLLGHNLSPHMIMRNFFIGGDQVHLTNAYLCSECGLCNMYACPLDLSPRDMLRKTKKELAEKGIKNPHSLSDLKAHPEREFRRVNTDRLMARLDIDSYDMHDIRVKTVDTGKVRIPLSQHIGTPASPVVSEGDRVKKGDLLAGIPADKLGAAVHSSISGTVKGFSSEYIEISG